MYCCSCVGEEKNIQMLTRQPGVLFMVGLAFYFIKGSAMIPTGVKLQFNISSSFFINKSHKNFSTHISRLVLSDHQSRDMKFAMIYESEKQQIFIFERLK